MTVLSVITTPEAVYWASDSQYSIGDQIAYLDGPKFTQVSKQIVIGCAGDDRVYNQVIHRVNWGKYNTRKKWPKDDADIYVGLFDEITAATAASGVNTCQDGFLLLTVGNRIFLFGDGTSLDEVGYTPAKNPNNKYFSVGSGSAYALGSIESHFQLSSTFSMDVLDTASWIACQFDAYCGGTVHVKEYEL